VVWLFGVVPIHSETKSIGEDSVIKIGNTSYKVVDRVVINDALVFRKPVKVKPPSCLVQRVTRDPNPKGCIPAGRISYGGILCGPVFQQPEESLAQTFARIPGKDAPNLLARIVGIHISRERTEGTLLIAVIACSSRIAVPVAGYEQLKRESSNSFNRLSLSISGNKRTAQLVLLGTATTPATYRIAGMNEVVLLVVPFKSLKGLKIEKTTDGKAAQTRSIDLIDGEYDLGSYSAADKTYTKAVSRDIVPPVGVTNE